MSSTYDPIIQKGYPWTRTIVFKKQGGFPLVLTGYTAFAQIKRNYADTAPVSMTVTFITSGDNNSITLSLTRTQVDAINFSTGVWDLRLIDAGGNPMMMVGGVVTIAPSVTL